MATASNKSVATRLAIRPGQSLYLINPPPQYSKVLGWLPSGAQIVDNKNLPADRVQMFASAVAELNKLLPTAIAATKPDGALWVSYPKIASGKSDLSRQVVHDAIRFAGWKPVAQISVDDIWSAIRARPATEAERRRI